MVRRFFDPTRSRLYSDGGIIIRLQRVSLGSARALFGILSLPALWNRTVNSQVVAPGKGVRCPCDVDCTVMAILLVMPVMILVKVVSSFP